MAKRRIKTESMEYLGKAIENTRGVVDIVTANAYAESVENEKRVEEVNDELNKKAETVKTPDPDKGNDVKNEYTAQLVLDESLSDFESPETSSTSKDGRSKKVYEEDDEDDYLDYDMFDFIYGLVTDCWPKPKNPLNHRIRKFMYIGSDDYLKTNSLQGVTQVATSGDTVEVYANSKEEFKDIIEICNMYSFKYEGPAEKRSSYSHWNFTLTIFVPCSGNGYPEMVEDYFDKLGMTMEDVMPADFCTQYRKRQARIEREVQERVNKIAVGQAIKEAVKKAYRDSEPLQTHLTSLYKTLDEAGLKYSKTEVKKTFMKEFDE